LLIMPSSHNLLLFLAASVLLALTPGPNLLYLVSRTLAQGRAAGFVSLAGTGSGFLFHILAAAFGLSAVFLAVPIAYDAVRWAGAAYLLWLAWDAIRPSKEDFRKELSSTRGLFVSRALPPVTAAKLYRMGIVTSILNPKVALFYLALFPQFVDPAHGSVLTQSLVLGFVQVIVVLLADGFFVLVASRVARALQQRPKWMLAQRWLLAGVFAGIAAKLALDDRR
jgi:threonine/homoserine/homoserine lactone efflux protein